MAIDWVHLPKEVMDAICVCMGDKKGFTLDRESGYWVHSTCRKPKILVAVQECDNCEKPFVPKYFEKIRVSFLGIECDQCDPPS